MALTHIQTTIYVYIYVAHKMQKSSAIESAARKQNKHKFTGWTSWIANSSQNSSAKVFARSLL